MVVNDTAILVRLFHRACQEVALTLSFFHVPAILVMLNNAECTQCKKRVIVDPKHFYATQFALEDKTAILKLYKLSKRTTLGELWWIKP